MRRALVILGHPHSESLGGALAEAYAQGLTRAGIAVEPLHLAGLEFQPLLRPSDPNQVFEPDLQRARQAIEQADHVAWFFPTWWAAPPALVKGFVDRMFTSGWAYQYRGKNPLPEGLLRGRSARMVTTMDSPSFWYTLWHARSVHTAMINATLKFVGFGPVESTTFYRVRQRAPATLRSWVDSMERTGETDGRRILARRSSRWTLRGTTVQDSP